YGNSKNDKGDFVITTEQHSSKIKQSSPSKAARAALEGDDCFMTFASKEDAYKLILRFCSLAYPG
ncbi:MAG: hypothetical protein LBL97_08365, partial [Prevotellaceae bacterium]|nr:hypothetical protein [Prevotellaceae bacterium]